MVADLDIATQLAEMQALIAAQNAQIVALQSQQNEGADDFLQQQLRQFEAEKIAPTPFTTLGCKLVGCGRLFRDHVEERMGFPPMPLGHTFYATPPRSSDQPKPTSFYAKDEPVRAVEPESSIEDTYMSVADAARALQLKQAEVKSLIADGQLKADKILGATFVRRVSVERIVAMAAVQEADEDVL